VLEQIFLTINHSQHHVKQAPVTPDHSLPVDNESLYSRSCMLVCASAWTEDES